MNRIDITIDGIDLILDILRDTTQSGNLGRCRSTEQVCTVQNDIAGVLLPYLIQVSRVELIVSISSVILLN